MLACFSTDGNLPLQPDTLKSGKCNFQKCELFVLVFFQGCQCSVLPFYYLIC